MINTFHALSCTESVRYVVVRSPSQPFWIIKLIWLVLFLSFLFSSLNIFLSHFSVTCARKNQVFNSLFDFYLLEMLLLLKQAFTDVYIHNFVLSASEAVRNLNVAVLNESVLNVTWDKPLETNGMLLGYGLNVSDGSGCVQKIYLNNSTNCETPVSTTHSYTHVRSRLLTHSYIYTHTQTH